MNKKQKGVYIYFLLLPFIDVITSLIVRLTNLNISLGMIVKGLTLVFITIYIFFYSKSNYKKRSIQYMILLLGYLVLYILFKKSIFGLNIFVNEMSIFCHYFYFPIMLIGILNLFDDWNIDNKLIHKILIINSICYAILLLIPLISGTAFSSYSSSDYLGNNGWFFAANEIGTITILLLSSQLYFLKPDKKWRILIFSLILFSITFIGTKVSFMGMIIVTILIVIFLIIKWRKEIYLTSILLVLLVLGIGLVSPTIINFNMRVQNIDEVETRNIRRLDEFIENETLLKTIKLALNGREDFFVTNLYVYNHGKISNKFLGIGWNDWEEINYDCEPKLIEIDYLDIFIHYGIIGFIVYFLPLIYFFRQIVVNKHKKSVYFKYNLIVFILGIVISSFAGHTLSAPAVSIYLILIFYLLYRSGNDVNEKDSDFY